jgi:hypothetical protein
VFALGCYPLPYLKTDCIVTLRMVSQEILTKVSQEKLTKKGGSRGFLSRNLYKNVFIKKITPVLSDRLKGA